MKGIVYRAEDENCSVSFPIMVVINDYVIIGPEFKPGIQAAVLYSEFKQFVGGNEKCLDIFQALKPNFITFDVQESLEYVLAVYGWMANYTKTQNLIPAPVFPVVNFDKEFKFSKVFVSKFISADLSKVDLSQSRNTYFSTLAGTECKIITEKDFSTNCFMMDYVKVIDYDEIFTLEEFKDVLKNIVLKIETLAKEYNFIHGNLHIGHVSKDAKMIDFDSSIDRLESTLLDEYLKKRLPRTLYPLAADKVKYQPIDMWAASTLMEIYTFLDSIHTDKKHKSFGQFHHLIISMKTWIIDTMTEYLESDISIFTMLKKKDFFGGCETKFGLPSMYTTINEEFPTHHFLCWLANIG